MAKPSKLDVEEKPWKYVGYRGYTEIISSDDDFYVLRRFDNINVRLALRLQDDISSLEERLEYLDVAYSSKEAQDLNNGTFRDDLEDRAELLDLLLEKVEQYSKYRISILVHNVNVPRQPPYSTVHPKEIPPGAKTRCEKYQEMA